MASTYSTNLKIELIGTGEQSGTWGATTNTNFGTALEQAIVGYGNPNFASDANLTLTLTDSNASQTARAFVLNVTSSVSLSTTRELVVPTIQKPYIIRNNTTGGQSITVKTSGGTGITVPTTKYAFVYADGTNVVSAIDHIPSLTLGSALALTSGGTGATSATAARQNIFDPIFDAKGDIVVATAADTAARKAVGSNGTLLLADSSQSDGLQWAGGFSRKNIIIGGNFTTNPWQRGTSFTAVANAQYTADRFETGIPGSTAVVDLLKTADAPTASEAGVYAAHCLHHDVTTADASIAAGDAFLTVHKIEGLNLAHMGFGQAGTRYMTLSFWHKHTKTGTHCVALRNGAADRSYVAEYTQDVSDTWEKATITFAVDTSGTWLYDTGIGLRISFALAAGSTYQTAANAWTAGNYFATANQVNNLDSTSNNFKLALIQLEAGTVATEFENRQAGFERLLCQRYAYVIGEADLHGSNEQYICGGFCNTTSNARLMTMHPVQMRGAPTATVSDSTKFGLRNSSDTGIATTSVSLLTATDRDMKLDAAIGSASLATGDATFLYIQASQSAKITVSAEL